MLSIWSILALSLVITLTYGVGVPGGHTNVTIPSNDPTITFMVKGINEMYARKGDNSFRTIKRVVKARSQVVAGIKSEITIEITHKKKTEVCVAVIWSRPWRTVPYQFVSGPTCSTL